jgi:hypothetical protein
VTEVHQKSALVNAELEKFVNTVKEVTELYSFSWARRNLPAPTDPAELDIQISRLQAFYPGSRPSLFISHNSLEGSLPIQLV